MFVGFYNQWKLGKNKERNIKMIKADEKVIYEGIDEPVKFTNFEELQKRVEILQEVINEHTEIFRTNNLVRKEEIVAPYFDEDEVYKRLEEEDD